MSLVSSHTKTNNWTYAGSYAHTIGGADGRPYGCTLRWTIEGANTSISWANERAHNRAVRGANTAPNENAISWTHAATNGCANPCANE
jgi:hypothetical protein